MFSIVIIGEWLKFRPTENKADYFLNRLFFYRLRTSSRRYWERQYSHLYMHIAFSSNFTKFNRRLFTGALDKMPKTTVKMTCLLRFVTKPGNNRTMVALVLRENMENTHMKPITLPTMMWSCNVSLSNSIPGNDMKNGLWKIIDPFIMLNKQRRDDLSKNSPRPFIRYLNIGKILTKFK